MTSLNAVGHFGKWGSAVYTTNNMNKAQGATTPRPKKFFTSKNRASNNSSTTTTTPKFAMPKLAPSTPSTSSLNDGRRCLVSVRIRPHNDEADGVIEANEAEAELYLAECDKTFKFDHIYGAESGSQDDVFARTVQPVLDRFLAEDGGNAAILAYGQTGTGKTYTMGTQGGGSNGVIPRVIREVFAHQNSATAKISFFEILNEKIYDLLKAMKVPLGLKEAFGNEFYIPDLKSDSVGSVEEALRRLEHGCRTRATGATAQNTHSSRSHAIFRITVEEEGRREKRISLVDLAGSESNASSEDQERRQEGVNINKGLSVLNRCIAAICDRDRHVPFRDSVLTKVLRDCLVGHDGTTAMIACVSPAARDVKETVNTLRYADFVKRLEKPAMPSHLEMSASKRRFLPPTPAAMSRKRFRMNHTIETPTPTKKQCRTTPKMMNKSASGSLASSTCSRMPSLETIRDENGVDVSMSLSDISSIQNQSVETAPPPSSSTMAAQNLSVMEARSVLSPMMRNLKDDLKKHIEETINATMLLATAQKERKKSRATSSPVLRRRSPRLLAAQNDSADAEDEDETIISGPQLSHVRQKMRDAAGSAMRRALSDATNRKVGHLKKVEESSSPKLAKRESDDDKENPKTPGKMMAGPSTPPVSLMEQTLGLNPDSPLMLFGCTPPQNKTVVQGSTTAKAKRSVRRTTMMQPELRRSILKMRSGNEQPDLRRSKRLSEMPPPPPKVHPLQVKSHWSFKNQEEHNDQILGLLNTANMNMLQKLPGIGPKTAIKLHTQRDFRGGFKSLDDLKSIPGLPKTFFARFCVNNQIELKSEN